MEEQLKEEKKAYDREWKRNERLKNPEKVREKAREKYRKIRENPELLKKHRNYHREYSKKYNQTEKRKIYRREWMRTWNRKNAKKIYEQRRKRPYEQLASVIRARIYDVLKNGYKSDRTEKLLGITIKELKIYLENKFKDGMTWENYGFYSWHIDHILPLSSFDLSNPEQQKKAFHYTNLQPLWAKENLPNLELVDIGEELHLGQEAHPERMGETISAWLQALECK